MVLPVIPYHAALAMMKAGRVNHRPEDVVAFGTGYGRVFYVDQRTRHKPGSEPDVVYPLGYSDTGSWFWICPRCGGLHSLTRKLIREFTTIDCGNPAAKYRRFQIGPDGKKYRMPPKPIKLIGEQFGW